MRHDLLRFSGRSIPEAAIFISREALGMHAGLIYRDGKRELQRLEFYLDGHIRSIPWWGRHLHVIPNSDDDALENLSSLCRVIADRYNRLPSQHLFGFRRSEPASINQVTGALDLGASNEATCANFVLLVLSTVAIELVASGSDWPHRPSDNTRCRQLLPALEAQYAHDTEHLERLRAESEGTSPRVAPEEVVGAAMCPAPPASQEYAERAGEWIMGLFDHNARFLDSCGNLLPAPSA